MAIGIIGSSLKKNVWLPEKYTNGFFKIYPNQYVILVGPPGVGKGTAINPAIDLARRAQTVNYIADRTTAEKVVEQIGKGFSTIYKSPSGIVKPIMDNSATIVSTELPIFLQTSEWMLPLMCEMWDRNEFSYATKNKGSINATNICISLIAGCVPDYIRKLNKDAMSAITGGFTSRCIFVYATERSKTIAWPATNGNMAKLETDLVNDLKEISLLSGEVHFDAKARTMWEAQYQSMKPDMFESEVLSGFKSRMKSHIFKTAMILSISENNNKIVLERHLYNAIKLVQDIRNRVDTTFRSLGESPLAAQQDRVLKYIAAKQSCTSKAIFAHMSQHMTYDQFLQILFVLEMAEKIKKRPSGKVDMYELF